MSILRSGPPRAAADFRLRLRLCFNLWLGLALPATAEAASSPATSGTGGMVVSDSALATEAGIELLRAGGDAADAAVATALVLGVVQNFASGLGGGGFALVFRQTDSRAYALDFREVAPAAASSTMFQDSAGLVIAGASTRGPRAVGVPGELAGLFFLHHRHGKLPWAQVVAPALRLARDGFVCPPLLATRLERHLAGLKLSPALALDFLTATGTPHPSGTVIKRRALAGTLQEIARTGADSFYRGALADRIAAAMSNEGGLVTRADLEGYKVIERPTVSISYHGRTVHSMPPPSSGGAVLLQVLRVLEALPLTSYGLSSVAYLHRLAEALKHAFADRAAVMGDPAFTEVPVARLVSDATVDKVRGHFRAYATGSRADYGAGFTLPLDSGTSHVSVIDSDGDAISLTTTVNTTWGSGWVAGQTGLLMNNQMDDFVAKPGVPNAFGLIGTAANAIAPFKRPLSSMSPTLVVRDGKIEVVIGASGGPTIITATLQVLIDVLDFEIDPRAAVEAPRIHHQWVPEVLTLEPEFAPTLVDALRDRGHTTRTDLRFSAVQVLVVGRDGRLRGAADPSKQGTAAALRP